MTKKNTNEVFVLLKILVYLEMLNEFKYTHSFLFPRQYSLLMLFLFLHTHRMILFIGKNQNRLTIEHYVS